MKLKKNILDVINILGFIIAGSLFFILGIQGLIILNNPFPIICGILSGILISCIIFECLKKIYKQYVGIFFGIVLIIIFIISFFANEAYMVIKNQNAKLLLNSIEKIEIGDRIIDKETLKNTKIKFLNEQYITKGIYTGKIYYTNGQQEEIRVIMPGSILVINDNYYYLEGIYFW